MLLPWKDLNGKVVQISVCLINSDQHLQLSASEKVNAALRELKSEETKGTAISSTSCGHIKHILLTTHLTSDIQNCFLTPFKMLSWKTATHFKFCLRTYLLAAHVLGTAQHLLKFQKFAKYITDIVDDFIEILPDMNQTYVQQNKKHFLEGKCFDSTHMLALKCLLCNKEFKSTIDLNQHQLNHHKVVVEPIQCVHCHKQFNNILQWSRHVRAHNYDAVKSHKRETSHKCALCDKSFTYRSNLKAHLQTHTGEKPHKCELCDKSFARKPHLQQHLKTHTGEKPYECKLCQKTYSRRFLLEEHLNTHTGEKQHKCTLCAKSFTYRSNLKAHLNTHTGEKQHKCALCAKSFTWKSNLKAHLRTHTGEKQHKCTLCAKSFTYRSNLKAHLRTHTGQKPYPYEVCDVTSFECFICKENYRELSELQKHFTTKHTTAK